MSGVQRKSHTSTEAAWVRYSLIGVALVFMALFLLLPLAAVFAEALRKGWGAYWEALKEPDRGDCVARMINGGNRAINMIELDPSQISRTDSKLCLLDRNGPLRISG